MIGNKVILEINLEADLADFKPLDAGPGDEETPAHARSKLRRTTLVITGIIACFLNAGIVFGYSAIHPVLLANGAFADSCGPVKAEPEADVPESPCTSQQLALAGMFTLATSALNIMSWPAGTVLDILGPRLMATCMGACTFIGCIAFGSGGHGLWQWSYVGGFLIMAVAGPPMFMATASFANLFPGHEGLITASLVGSFDASSAVFIGVANATSAGVTFNAAMKGFALLPLTCSVVAFMIWPRRPVKAELNEDIDDIVAGQGSGPPLAPLSTCAQLTSPECVLLTMALSVNMLCINFFIESVDDQVRSVTAEDEAASLAAAFSVMLPLGGLVYIPLVGAVSDRLKIGHAWFLLWVAMQGFWFLNQLYAATANSVVAYTAFALFAFCRPLLYTLAAASVGKLFGFATFGTVYGLAFAMAGFANFGVQPLRVLAVYRGFPLSNQVTLGLQLLALVPALALSRMQRTKDR